MKNKFGTLKSGCNIFCVATKNINRKNTAMR